MSQTAKHVLSKLQQHHLPAGVNKNARAATDLLLECMDSIFASIVNQEQVIELEYVSQTVLSFHTWISAHAEAQYLHKFQTYTKKLNEILGEQSIKQLLLDTLTKSADVLRPPAIQQPSATPKRRQCIDLTYRFLTTQPNLTRFILSSHETLTQLNTEWTCYKANLQREVAAKRAFDSQPMDTQDLEDTPELDLDDNNKSQTHKNTIRYQTYIANLLTTHLPDTFDNTDYSHLKFLFDSDTNNISPSNHSIKFAIDVTTNSPRLFCQIKVSPKPCWTNAKSIMEMVSNTLQQLNYRSTRHRNQTYCLGCEAARIQPESTNTAKIYFIITPCQGKTWQQAAHTLMKIYSPASSPEKTGHKRKRHSESLTPSSLFPKPPSSRKKPKTAKTIKEEGTMQQKSLSPKHR